MSYKPMMTQFIDSCIHVTSPRSIKALMRIIFGTVKMNFIHNERRIMHLQDKEKTRIFSIVILFKLK